MADTFTQQLRLTKQSDQENVNIWGNNYNDGVIDLSEDAIAARVDLNVTLSSLELSVANGSPDTSRPMFLHVIGNPGEPRVITVPPLQKLYVVSNETDPPFDVEIRTEVNPGRLVPPGAKSFVYVDQLNNIVRAPTDAAGDTALVLEAPFQSQVFDIDNATAGMTSVNITFQAQGGLTVVRIPLIDTTVSTDIFTIQPATGPVDPGLVPAGPNFNEYDLCLKENGVLVECFFRISNVVGPIQFNPSAGGQFTPGSQRVTQYPLEFIIHRGLS